MKNNVLFLLLLFLPIEAAFGQIQSKVYSVFILNFIKNTEWPNTESKSDILVGIIGDDEIFAELSGSSIKSIGNKKLTIKKIKSFDEDIQVCYVPEGKLKNEKVMNGKQALFITNSKGGAKAIGGLSIFLGDDGKVKFEYSLKGIEARGLRISSTIKSLGINAD